MKLHTFTLLLLTFTFGCSAVQDEKPKSPKRSSQALAAPTATIQKSNSAIVISQHANLRSSDNASATVIRTVPQDTSIEVIKQQGAWFYVKTETETGWMHGNTLKLQSFEAVTTAPPVLPVAAKTPAPVADTTVATADEDAETEDAEDLRIKGNRNSKIYHLPGCASYSRIADRNIVWFKTSAEAEAQGYRIARNC